MRKTSAQQTRPAKATVAGGKLDRTRAAIAEAALLLFEARGFDNVTVDEIAESAGVARRTIFRHYPAKSDIVIAPTLIAFRALPDGLRAQTRSLPLSQALSNSLGILIEELELRRDVLARNARVVMQSQTLRMTTLALKDAAIADLRTELAARFGRDKTMANKAGIWAEILFVVAFGARDRWLLNPRQKIAPIIAESVTHAAALGIALPWVPDKHLGA